MKSDLGRRSPELPEIVADARHRRKEVEGNMKFEVGKSYYPQDRGYDPVEVIKRTDKSIRVKRWYDGSTWWMRIRTDSEGNEMCIDSTAPKKWRFVFTYCADDPVKE